MRHDGWMLCLLAAATVACSRGDDVERRELLATPAARQLVGVWDVRFQLDRAVSVKVHPADAPPVIGMLALAEDRFGRVSTSDFGEATHDGVYDVDFAPFGFTSRGASDVPAAIARVVPTASGDSLYVLLSPGTSRLEVAMTGRLVGDSASGVWQASAFSSGGGTGRFAMRRRKE